MGGFANLLTSSDLPLEAIRKKLSRTLEDSGFLTFLASLTQVAIGGKN
jgi:hypothetical protein